MSQAVSGKSGSVEFSSKLAEVKGFTLNADCNTPDVTSTDSNGWAEFVAGVKSWSGSFDTLVCVDLVGSVGVGSFKVGTAASASTPIFTGTIIVKGPSATLAVEGEVRYSYNFQGTGPLTIDLTA